MSSDGVGYLLPDNPEPDRLDCIRVYYPSDAMYLRALVGSLSYLGTWLAWERDEEKRGRLAAIAWKDANDRTFDEMPLGCGEDCPDCELCDMTKEELAEIIKQELENMTINITNTVGCGCGCEGTTVNNTADMTPPDLVPVDPGDYVPGDYEPGIVQSDAQKCNMANYLVYAIRLSLMRAIEHDSDLDGFNGFISDLWGGMVDWVEGKLGAITYGSFVWIMRSINGNQTAAGRVADAFDEHFDYYVCQLFQATDPTNAYQRIFVALRDTIQDDDIRSSAQDIAQVMPYQVLFASVGAIEIPAGFEGRECCGSTPVPEEPGVSVPDTGNYIWVVPDVDTTSQTFTDAMSITSPEAGIALVQDLSGAITKEGAVEYDPLLVRPANFVAEVGIEITVIEPMTYDQYEVPRLKDVGSTNSPYSFDILTERKIISIANTHIAELIGWAEANYDDSAGNGGAEKFRVRWLNDGTSARAVLGVRFLYEVS